jgi:hypothetical protein
MARRHSMAGYIASCGFESGDRIVVGVWHESPIGPFDDVMWARPDDSRVLLAPSDDAVEFVTAVYAFDVVEVVACTATCDGRDLQVQAGPIDLELSGGPSWPIPFRRPAWFTRVVEGPIAARTMGVQTFGVSPTGVREWYRADRHRRVVGASASVDGTDLGQMRDVAPPMGVGFSEPPRRPSIVAVRPLLEDRSGRLDRIVSRRR